MKSVYQRLDVGHTFELSGVEWFVREKWRGKICIQLCSQNDENSREETGGLWVNPSDSRFVDEIARIIDLSNRNFNRCETCVAAGYTTYEDLCSGCKNNVTQINQLKAMLG
jgi:hypothetical protein